jgi:hypothetical protein
MIPDIRPWLERKFGETSYHLTQVLTEHGCFQAYLHRIGKVDNDRCVYCVEKDTPRHTIFECIKWNDIRSTTWEAIGRNSINPDKLVDTMSESSETWAALNKMICTIMKIKEADERKRKNELNQL